MATARKLSLFFVVAVLVASLCFADVAQGSVQGRTVRATKMQEQPGIGDFVYSNLKPNVPLNVDCRFLTSDIQKDPWWLKVHAVPSGTGWVPDVDVQCGNAPPASHCESAPLC